MANKVEVLLMKPNKHYLITWDTTDDRIPVSIIKNKLVGKFKETTSQASLFFNVVYFMEQHTNDRVSYGCISQRNFSQDFFNAEVENLKVTAVKEAVLTNAILNVTNILSTN